MEIYIILQNTNQSYIEKENHFSYVISNKKENYNYLIDYLTELYDEHIDDEMMLDNNLHTRYERELCYNKKQKYYEYPSFTYIKKFKGMFERFGE